MKKASIALLAGASAIQIREEAQFVCIPISESDEIFKHIDTNHNHKLGPPELYGAIRHWAEVTHRNLTEANVHWIEEHAAHDAATNGHDATMDHKEFWMFINQFVKYFKIKGACREGAAQAHAAAEHRHAEEVEAHKRAEAAAAARRVHEEAIRKHEEEIAAAHRAMVKA